MAWEYDLAKKMKEDQERARDKAIEEASGFIGKIERASPLKISILGGEVMYEKNEIFMSRTFKEYSASIRSTGKKVIVVPIDDLNTIAVLDVVEG